MNRMKIKESKNLKLLIEHHNDFLIKDPDHLEVHYVCLFQGNFMLFLRQLSLLLLESIYIEGRSVDFWLNFLEKVGLVDHFIYEVSFFESD